MFASWEDFDFYSAFKAGGFLKPLPRRKPDRAGGRYLVNVVSAFDIETSRIDLPIENGYKQNSHSFMYVWQFQLEDVTIMGRTWEEFFGMCARIRDALALYKKDIKANTVPVLICWVHNLAYEWQFLQGIYTFRNEDVFFRDQRKPIWARMYDCIELRCSYIQTNMSLAHLTKQMGVEEKLSGEIFDYSKMRYPWTELSEYETEYCIRDVRSLVKCMRLRMEKDGDSLQTLPLTSTGYVRRDCKEAIKPLYFDIRDMKPDYLQYRMLRDAFRGGNTHANRKHVGKILENVASYDMTSCYPAQQLTKKFPMKPFKWLDNNLNMERVLTFVGLGYAVVARYRFEGLKIKEKIPIPYLALARTKSADFIGGIDNGRILYAGICECALTEIDLEIVLKQYTFDRVYVLSAMVARKDYLPVSYRKVIQKYYELKTTLKGTSDPEEAYIYAKSKEKLNSVYGMSCQDPLHAKILYDDGNYTIQDLNKGTDEERKSALTGAAFPYQWGVYVTAYARQALQEAIDLIGFDRMVYCDTDSVKMIGTVDLSGINKKREKLADRQGAVATDRKGIAHYMGVFEYEGTYDKFITQGAKRYAYVIGGCKYAGTCPNYPRCKMGVTVSGVSKKTNPKTGVPIAVEELKDLKKFKDGMIWRESAGSLSVYNDDDNFWYQVDEDRGVMISPNIAILPNTYQMGFSKDYTALLQDVELYGEYIDRRK